MASRRVESTLDLLRSVETLVPEVDLRSWREARRVLWEDPLPLGSSADPLESADRLDRARSELRRIVTRLAKRHVSCPEIEQLARRVV